MNTFIIMAGRARCRMACGHKRCRKHEFFAQWYDYMYGVNGKIRFAQGRMYDGVKATPDDDESKFRLELFKLTYGLS